MSRRSGPALGPVALGALVACDYVPAGAVTDDLTWHHLDGQDALAPTPAMPLLPLNLFGVHYDTDLVLVSDHPTYRMHELALVRVGNEEVWFAKDSTADGVQTISSSRPDLVSLFAEVAVPRHVAPVEVVDKSDGDTLNLRITYENPLGQLVEVTYRGPRPIEGTQGRRNSSTMNHSQQVATAVLDVSGRALGEATISFDGVPARIERLAGVYGPIAAALVQTQAGFALPNYRVEPKEGGFTLIRPGAGDWPTQATEEWTWKDSMATHGGSTVRFDGGVAEAWVRQGEREVLHLQLDGPLPPVPWDGEPVERLFRLDVNGQANGVGRIRVEGDTLCIAPDAPRWFAERPMQVVVQGDLVTGSMGCD